MTGAQWTVRAIAVLIFVPYFSLTGIHAAKSFYQVTPRPDATNQWIMDTSFGFPIHIAFTSGRAPSDHYSDRVMFILIEESYCTTDHFRAVFTGLAARYPEDRFIKIDVYSDPEMLRRAIERYKSYPDDAIFSDTPEGEELEKKMRGELYIPKTGWARARYYKTARDGERFFYKRDPQKVDMVEVVLSPPPMPKYVGDLQTDLFLACRVGDLLKAKSLIDKGAQLGYKDLSGETALIYAVGHGKAKVVRLLLARGADVDGKNRYGQTALNEALSHGFYEVVHELLKHNPDVNACYGPGISPLHLAASRGYTDVVDELLANGANPNAVDENGNTPLFNAIRTRHLRIVRALLTSGALVNVRNNRADTPLSLAKQVGAQMIIEALKSANRPLKKPL